MSQDLYALINDRLPNIRMVVSDAERKAFDNLPPGPSKQHVVVTDQLTGNRAMVYRTSCGAGCYCAAKAMLMLEAHPAEPIDSNLRDFDTHTEKFALDNIDLTPEQRNSVRARWAAHGLKAYAERTGELGEPWEAVIADLLSDLMHLVDSLKAGGSLQPDYWPGYDEEGAFNGMVGVASRRYEEELEGEA